VIHSLEPLGQNDLPRAHNKIASRSIAAATSGRNERAGTTSTGA
jgi:hypothetical protein